MLQTRLELSLGRAPLTKLCLELEDVGGYERVDLASLEEEPIRIVATSTPMPSSVLSCGLSVVMAGGPRMSGPCSWSHSRRGRAVLTKPEMEREAPASFPPSHGWRRDVAILVSGIFRTRPPLVVSPTPTISGMLDKNMLIAARLNCDVLGIGVGAWATSICRNNGVSSSATAHSTSSGASRLTVWPLALPRRRLAISVLKSASCAACRSLLQQALVHLLVQ